MDLQVILSLVDRLTAPIRGPMAALQGLETQAQRVEQGMSQMGRGAGMLAAAGTLALPFALGLKAAIDFESEMANVRKVVNFDTPLQFAAMKSDLMGLSEEIPISAAGFAQIAAAAGQAGIARGEIVEFARDAAKMGVAFDLSADQAGAAMTGLRNIFHLTQGQVVLLGDSVNQLSNNMDAKASAIVDILNRVGGTGRLVGLTGQQVSALAASFTALKTPPEIAATGINALLMRMATAPSQGKLFQKGLKEIGLNAQQLGTMLKNDAQGALIEFLTRVKGSKDVLGTLTKLFGAEYSDDIAKLVGNIDVYKKALGLVGDQAKYTGSMTKEYQNRADTTANSLQLLKNIVTNLGIALGDILLPTVRQITDGAGKLLAGFRQWAAANPRLARTVVMVTLSIIGLLLVLGNAQVALGGLTLSLSTMRGGLALLITRMNATRTAAIAMQAALMARVTMGVPTAAQAAQMATGWGRASMAMQGFGLAARAALAPLLANPITWIVLAVVALGAAFIYAWRQSAQFRDSIMAAIQPLLGAWKQLRASFALLGTALGPAGAGVAKFFGQWHSWLDAAAYGLGYFLGFVITGFVLLGSILVAKMVQAFSGVVTFITGIVNWIVGFFTGDMAKMKLGTQQILSGLLQVFNAYFGWIVDVVKRFGPSVLAWLQSGLNTALAWVQGVATRFREAGANIVQGMVDGIKSKIGGAVTAIQSVGEGIVSRFKGLMDMHSPSRVFMQLGGYVGEGLALGIGGSSDRAVAATNRMAGDVVSAAGFSLPSLDLKTSSSSTGAKAQGRNGVTTSATSSGGTTITIQNLHVQAENAEAFVAGLKQLVEAHQ